VDYVIAPSYQLHQDMGLLKTTMSGVKLEETMSFRKFLSGRMLWDESMAWHAYQWTAQNPNGLLLGLVGADHGTSSSTPRSLRVIRKMFES
jgi:Haem-binding uptake, Tiki superfamily, ChaN